MEENNQGGRRIIKISRRKFIVSIVVLVVISAVLYFGLLFLGGSFGLDSITGSNITGQSIPPSSYTEKTLNEMKMQNPMSGSNKSDSSIRDTREFMKTDYSANILTRDVPKVVTQIKNIVKGSDGRVDNFQSREKYGRISFVVPKSKFESFRDEMESVTHHKLYIENISSTNLLNQKQGIENQIDEATSSLESLNRQKDDLISSHNKTVDAINKELNSIQKNLVYVRTSIESNTDVDIIISLRKQEASFASQQTTQKNKLNEENRNHSSKLQNLENLINNANANLANSWNKDEKFTDNIETVKGYVNVSWITIWEMVKVFSPIHPTWIIIIILIVLRIIFRKKLPKVVLE